MPLPFTVVVSWPPRHERGGHPDRAGGKATTLLRVLQHIWQGGSDTSWDNRHSEATQPAGDHDTQVAALRLGAWLCPTCLLRDLWVRKVASGRLDQRLGVPERSVAAEGSEPRAAGMKKHLLSWKPESRLLSPLTVALLTGAAAGSLLGPDGSFRISHSICQEGKLEE